MNAQDKDNQARQASTDQSDREYIAQQQTYMDQCVWCGAPFLPNDPPKRFCDEDCEASYLN